MLTSFCPIFYTSNSLCENGEMAKSHSFASQTRTASNGYVSEKFAVYRQQSGQPQGAIPSQPTHISLRRNKHTNKFVPRRCIYLSPVRVDVGPIHRVSFFFLWRLIPSSVVATHLSSAQPENAGESLVGVVSVAGRMVRRGRTTKFTNVEEMLRLITLL